MESTFPSLNGVLEDPFRFLSAFESSALPDFHEGQGGQIMLFSSTDLTKKSLRNHTFKNVKTT